MLGAGAGQRYWPNPLRTRANRTQRLRTDSADFGATQHRDAGETPSCHGGEWYGAGLAEPPRPPAAPSAPGGEEVAMRRLRTLVASIGVSLALAGVLAAPAGAYGGGADHDMWQVGISFNCNNPDICGPALGGFWGWVEFDRSADGLTTWGDAELTGCSHTVGGGGPGTAGAGHISAEIESWTIAPGSAGPRRSSHAASRRLSATGPTPRPTSSTWTRVSPRSRATTARPTCSGSRRPASPSRSRSRSGPRSSAASREAAPVARRERPFSAMTGPRLTPNREGHRVNPDEIARD